MTELLVVIGIIILVVGIAMPSITTAWKKADRARTAGDLQAIAGALEAYKQDHGFYPSVLPPPTGVDVNYNGARMLCRALIGPGPATHTNVMMIPDGAGSDPNAPQQPGPGFRVRGTTGKVYGPYLNPDSFKMGNPSPTPPTTPGMPMGWLALLDRYNKPILYYPATGTPNVNADGGYVMTFDPLAARNASTRIPLYNQRDNTGAMQLQAMRLFLGDHNNNGRIDAGESAAYTGGFILWSSGPDERFGPTMDLAPPTGTLNKDDVPRCDDITSFKS
jgi:type II secretory pathway pseudopilin PulG